MGKFEQTMQQMASLATEERIEMIASKKDLCICGDCPSYNDCAGEANELLYCVLGKSQSCITDEIICTCPDCPVTDQMGLEYEFFCTRGAEREQRGM